MRYRELNNGCNSALSWLIRSSQSANLDLFGSETMRQIFERIRKWITEVLLAALTESVNELTQADGEPPPVIVSDWDKTGDADGLWELLLSSLQAEVAPDGKATIRLP